METCSIEDCNRKLVAKGWCMTHYQRQRRTGTTDLITPEETDSLANGYPVIHKGAKGKRVTEYVHRQVLFDKIGLGPHPCHYCGRPLNWQIRKRDQPWPEDFLTVDHLDHDKTNNDPSNLVPCCHRCNAGKHPKGCQCITHRT